MKTYLLHHAPKSAAQDTWAVAFSLPYIASRYARAGAGVWYVKTWLTSDQIRARLAVLFDSQDELRIHELSRKEASLAARLSWLEGRVDIDDADAVVSPARFMWGVLQSAVEGFVGPSARDAAARGTSSGSSRAA